MSNKIVFVRLADKDSIFSDLESGFKISRSEVKEIDRAKASAGIKKALTNGRLEICDKADYDAFVEQYEADMNAQAVAERARKEKEINRKRRQFEKSMGNYGFSPEDLVNKAGPAELEEGKEDDTPEEYSFEWYDASYDVKALLGFFKHYELAHPIEGKATKAEFVEAAEKARTEGYDIANHTKEELKKVYEASKA